MTGTVKTERGLVSITAGPAIGGSADRLAIRLADLRQAEQAIRTLLDSLKRQVGSAAEQSQRLRSGVADAHGAAAVLQESARHLPDTANVQASVDAALAGAQARLDALVETAIDRMRDRMHQAQADLDAMITSAVSALSRSFDRAAEQAPVPVTSKSPAAFVQVPSHIAPVLGPPPFRVGMLAKPAPTTPRLVLTMPAPMWAMTARSAA